MVSLVGAGFSALSYRTADYMADIKAMQKSIRRRKVFAFDLESEPNPGQEWEGAGFNPHTSFVCWMSVKTQDGVWDWPIDPGANPWGHLNEFLSDPSYTAIAHQAAFETKFYIYWYWKKHGKWKVPKCTLICTMLASWMLDENRKKHGLKDLTIDLLNRDVMRYEEALTARSSLWDSWKWRKYSQDDSTNCYDLWFGLFKPALMADERTWRIFNEVELPNIITAAESELIGVRVHRKRIKRYRQEAIKEMRLKEQAIYKKVGQTFNIDSPPQLAHVLFNICKISKSGIKRGKSGIPSVDEDVLADLAARDIPIAEDIDKYREHKKEVGSFWKKLHREARLHDGYVFPDIRTAAQKTGRWYVDPFSTMKRPPSWVRHSVIARKGYKLVGGDWSQAELRIVAHLSQDPTMRQVYIDDLDIHQVTSDNVGCTRQDSKPINFGLIYLMGAESLRRKMKKSGIIKTVEECQEYIAKWFDTYPGVRDYHRRTEAFLRANGYVRNPIGRMAHLQEVVRQFYNTAVRRAINYRVQSFVAEWMKLAQKRIREKAVKKKLWGPERAHILFTVHDEIIGEAPEGMAEEFQELMRFEMENVVKLIVPVKADIKITNSWFEMKA